MYQVPSAGLSRGQRVSCWVEINDAGAGLDPTSPPEEEGRGSRSVRTSWRAPLSETHSSLFFMAKGRIRNDRLKPYDQRFQLQVFKQCWESSNKLLDQPVKFSFECFS